MTQPHADRAPVRRGGPHPYKLASIVLGAIGLFFIGLLLVGFLLPNGWTAERTILIAAPPEAVFPHVARAAAWGEWSPSPDTGVELFGPEEGRGSGRRWDDPMYGTGEFQVATAVDPEEVTYDVAIEGGSIRIRGRMRLDPDSGGTRVRWSEEGDFGWNPLLGYLSGRMEELQGEQMEMSLATLKAVAEGRPVPF